MSTGDDHRTAPRAAERFIRDNFARIALAAVLIIWQRDRIEAGFVWLYETLAGNALTIAWLGAAVVAGIVLYAVGRFTVAAYGRYRRSALREEARRKRKRETKTPGEWEDGTDPMKDVPHFGAGGTLGGKSTWAMVALLLVAGGLTTYAAYFLSDAMGRFGTFFSFVAVFGAEMLIWLGLDNSLLHDYDSFQEIFDGNIAFGLFLVFIGELFIAAAFVVG